MSRQLRFNYLKERLPHVDESIYHVKGAPEYISLSEYEQSKNDTTEQELKKLYTQLQKGGKYVNLLSPYAKTQVSETLSAIDREAKIMEQFQ